MKKTAFAFEAVLVALAITCHALAAEEKQEKAPPRVTIGIGAMTWFAWWDPFFKNDISSKYSTIYYHFRKRFSNPPSFLYGPTLSIGFLDRWSLSFMFMYGHRFRFISSDASAFSAPAEIEASRSDATSTKYDLDSLVGFRIHRYVKIFAGMKVQGYHYNERLIPLSITFKKFLWLSDNMFDSVSYGPGIGLGFTIPLGLDFYLMGSVSGVYLRAKVDADSKQIIDMTNGGFLHLWERQVHDVWGGNGSLSVGYNVRAASLTIIAGGRYQYLKYFTKRFSDATMWMPLNIVSYPQCIFYTGYAVRMQRKSTYHRKADQFYGITLSVMYSVDIGSG